MDKEGREKLLRQKHLELQVAVLRYLSAQMSCPGDVRSSREELLRLARSRSVDEVTDG